MKYISMTLFSLLIMSCGNSSATKAVIPVNGTDGTSCSVEGTVEGGTITCSDGTSALIPSGTDGKNGLSAVFSVISANTAQCPTGGNIILVGQDVNTSGIFASNDTDIQSAIVCNGAQGEQGIQGPTPKLSPVSEIMPCGLSSSPYKEILLCLNNGSILSSFSDTPGGLDTRLANLPTGQYEDTDNSGCTFNIVVGPDNSSVVSWANGSNLYSTWNSDQVTCQAN